jgi:hypothetical protein
LLLKVCPDARLDYRSLSQPLLLYLKHDFHARPKNDVKN